MGHRRTGGPKKNGARDRRGNWGRQEVRSNDFGVWTRADGKQEKCCQGLLLAMKMSYPRRYDRQLLRREPRRDLIKWVEGGEGGASRFGGGGGGGGGKELWCVVSRKRKEEGENSGVGAGDGKEAS